MNFRKFPLLAFLCVALLLFSCKKDIDTVAPPVNNQPGFQVPAATPVTGRITGIVVDENNLPVQNADVTLSAAVYQTDSRGLFQIDNAQLDKYITTVIVNKTGYFKAYRSFSASASRNYLTIKLIPKTLGGTVDAAAGGLVSLPNGAAISFPTNSIVVKGTGAAYTGTVNVYASYIDPTTSDFAARVPGSMMARNNNTMYVLQSTGMIAVDLESASGQPLQLATGKNADVKMPIPASLLGKAPATIDTWSLDDRGIWVKEGTATRNGDHYDMPVSHFSFWNCDVPANAVYLTIHVQDQNNHPLPNAFIQLTIPNNNTWWATTYGHTDSTGTVSGLVPANLGMVMNISAGIFNCPSPIATQNVGPFSSDTTINVTVTINTLQSLTISGTVNACNNVPVQSGTASILVGNYNYYTAPIVNGNYTVSVPYCNQPSDVTVWLIDSTSGAYAGPVSVSVTGNTVAVPPQVACGTNQPALYQTQGCQVFGQYIAGIQLTASNYMAVIVNVQAPGSYSITSATINGMQFSGTGVLTHTGIDTIILPGNGMPVNTGTYTIPAAPGGIPCSSVVTVGVTNQPAVFSFGPSGGTCPNLSVAGNYVVNFPMNQTNFVTLTVNVTSPGYYDITTNGPVNGINFADSGVFTTTGPATVALVASGVPAAATTSTHVLQANGVTGCSFDIISTSTGSAVYTFNGAPGSCAGATIAGTYQSGVQLLGQNTVALQLNVTSAGAYSITTNVINGFRFTGSGVFSTLGAHIIVLTASGIPAAAGPTTFAANGGSAQSCDFTVQVN